MDHDEIEARILAVVSATLKAKVPCDAVEYTRDGTIRALSLNKGSLAPASPAPEIEDFFEKHMGKGSTSNG
jgi:hypothetical protein